MFKKFVLINRAILRLISHQNRSPVIIGGCGRSGTTLLSAIVGAHSRITTIDFETYAYVNMFSQTKNFNYLKKQIEKLRLEYFKAWCYGDLGSNKLCEKTPRNLYYINEIWELYHGKARFILIIRNGLDILTSKHPGQMDYYMDLDRWYRDTNLTLDLVDNNSHDDVLLISYEVLISNLLSSVKRITSFLEVPFDEKMMDFPNYSSVKSHGAFHGGGPQNIYKLSSRRWEQSEHKERLREINGSNEMRELIAKVDIRINNMLIDA